MNKNSERLRARVDSVYHTQSEFHSLLMVCSKTNASFAFVAARQAQLNDQYAALTDAMEVADEILHGRETH